MAHVLQIGIAGGIIGEGLPVNSLRGITLAVVVVIGLVFVATIALQSAALALSISIARAPIALPTL